MAFTKTVSDGLLAFSVLAGLAVIGLSPQPAAAAVVYCKTVGVPKGCVARSAPAVIACTVPGVPVGCVAGRPARAVRCTAPGFPAGCAAGVGRPMNRGGPVNRVGRR